VAHSGFGFAATESGPGFTWSENSHDNRLTPWRNDPVCDPSGEAVFIRDEHTGRFWSATPLPAGDGRRYTVRHGQGYTTWQHARDEIASSLRVFVPMNQPVKVFQLVLRNQSARPRECSVTLYAEWVLGVDPSRTGLHVVRAASPRAMPGTSLQTAWYSSICIPARSGPSPAIEPSSSDGTARSGSPRH
jgi:cellobiose phosphorylase